MSNNFLIVTKSGQENIFMPSCNPIKGLKVNVKGCNNIIKVHEITNFQDSKISIEANNSYVEIKRTSRLVKIDISIKNGDGQSIIIDEEFSSGGVTILMIEPRSRVRFGRDCMLSTDVLMLCGDGHAIFTNGRESIKNWLADINIGNHVWIGRGVRISRGASVADGSIVAFASVVTKKFKEKNVSIGGNPGKIISRDIIWERKSNNIYHKERLEKYGVSELIGKQKLLELVDADLDNNWLDIQIIHNEEFMARLESLISNASLDASLNFNSTKLKYLTSLLLMSGQTYEAITQVTKAINMNFPDNAWAYHEHAKFMQEEGKIEEALNSAKVALKLSDHEPEYVKHVVELFQQLDRIDDAIDCLSPFLEKKQVWALEIVCKIYLLRNDHKLYAEALSELLKINDRHLGWMRSLAEINLLRHQYEDANRLALRANDLEPKQMWTYIVLSKVSEKNNKIDNAITWVKKALKILPEHIGYRRRFLELLFKSTNFKLAEDTADYYISQGIDELWCWKIVCTCRYMTGDLQGAVNALICARNIDSKIIGSLADISRLLGINLEKRESFIRGEITDENIRKAYIRQAKLENNNINRISQSKAKTISADLNFSSSDEKAIKLKFDQLILVDKNEKVLGILQLFDLIPDELRT